MIDTFANRLKIAMEYNNVKLSKLSNQTGISKPLISNYLSGNYEAKQQNIYKIANALNVNPTWLMGYDVPAEKTGEINDNFSISLRELINHWKLDTEKLSDLINIEKSKLDGFINQTILPNDDELKKIVDFFLLKNIDELYDGSVIQRIIKKYEQQGQELMTKYRFCVEYENILIKISSEFDIPLDEVKMVLFDDPNNLSILSTYDNLYELTKKTFLEKYSKKYN